MVSASVSGSHVMSGIGSGGMGSGVPAGAAGKLCGAMRNGRRAEGIGTPGTLGPAVSGIVAGNGSISTLRRRRRCA